MRNFVSEGDSAFTKQRVCINTLKSFFPVISKISGIPVKYTNHSLHATAITRMFTSGVEVLQRPQAIEVQKLLGHMSIHQNSKGSRLLM